MAQDQSRDGQGTPPGLTASRVLALVLCAVAFFVGALAMAGWISNQPQWRSFLAEGSQMKPNAALCLMLLGLSAAFRSLETSGRRWSRVINILAGSAGVIGGLTVIEYASGVNLRIDELLFADTSIVGTSNPGRMSPPSAASFVLGAAAIILLTKRKGLLLAQWCALTTAFIPTYIIMSYAYGNMKMLTFGSNRSYMALPTALALVSVAIAVLLQAPHDGLMRTITSRTHASRVFRWLLVAVLLLPPVIGWFVLTLLVDPDAPPEVGVSTTIMLSIVVLAGFAWFTTARLNRAEEALRESERMQRLLAQIGEVATRKTEPTTLMGIIAELVAASFGASRSGFARVDLKAGRLAVEYDYHGRFPALAGEYAITQYPAHIKTDGLTGRTTAISDLAADPETATAYQETFKPLGIRAHLNVPLYRDDTWVANFWVTHHEPRRWTAWEVETMQIIADRVWLVIQQAQNEEQVAWLASFPRQNPNPILEMDARSGLVRYGNAAALALFPDIVEKAAEHPFLAGVLEAWTNSKDVSQAALNREIAVNGFEFAQTISHIPERDRLRVYSIDVSEQKRTQEAMRRSAERIQLISDAVPALISYVDIERRYRFCNRGYSDWFGLPREQVIGSRMEDIIGRSFWESIRPYVDAAFGGRAVAYETEAQYPSGTRWIHASYTPHRENGGPVFGIVIMVTDITERKRFDHALEERERLLSVATGGARVGLVVVNSKYEYLFANEAYGEVLGISSEDIVGKAVFDVVGSGWSQIQPNLDRAIAGERVKYELVLPPRQGLDPGPRSYDVIYEPQTDNTGESTVVVVIADITQRKRAEEALRESEARMRLFIEHAPSALAMFDRDMRYIAASNRWKQDYRIDSDIIGRSHYEVFSDVPQRWKTAHQRALAGEVVSSNEDAFQRADGTVQYIKWEIRPWFTANGEVGGIMMAAEDVTGPVLARRALEEAQLRLRDRALHLEDLVRERTSKLTDAVHELESWSYSIAHDMRAPLRAMHGFSALLNHNYGTKLDDTGKNYVKRITSSAIRLDRLIQDVLNYSKIARSDLQLRPVNMDSLLREIVDSYPGLQPPKTQIEIDSPLPPVLGNTAALTQVVSNLLGNAVKFVAPGVAPTVRVFAEDRGERVRLWVEDNGIGIPRESHSRIFQMFQRLHSVQEYEGTGIGLAIVRKAVERMGGTVGVESNAGKGSSFWVELLHG